MKSMKKRLMSLFLAIVLLLSALPAGVITSSAATLTLSQLKAKFPQDKYWNGGNSDSYTSRACTCHGGGICISGASPCTCNHFLGGTQCFGFALKLGYDAYGSNPRDWGRAYNLNSIKPGDIINYLGDGHTVFVTGVNGDTVTFAECNWRARCIISWNRSLKKSQFTNLKNVYVAPKALTTGSSAPVISKPSAPKNVNVSTTNGKIDIKWSAVSSAKSYVVYVYNKSNCSQYAFKKEVTSCSVSGIQLNPGRYWIYVHAVNEAGASPGSDCVNYLSAPVNLKATRSGTSITISWDAVPGANCYDVIMTDTQGKQSWLHSTEAKRIIKNCIPGSYKFEVQSLYRPNGTTADQVVGAHSNIISYYFGLSTPKNLKVNNDNSNMNISWEAVAGATCYDVVVVTPDGKTDYWHSHGTCHTITNYKNGVYKIKVQAIYRKNEAKEGQIVSEFSNVVIYDYQNNQQPDIHTHEWDLTYTVDKEATCTQEGEKSIHCKTCNERKYIKVIPANEHEFGEWEVEKEATAENDGVEIRKCRNCNYVETRTIEFIPTYDEDAPRITMSSVNAKVAEEVELSINIENNPGITALRLKLDYDESVLEMTDFKFAEALSSMNKGTSENYASGYSFSMYSATADLTDCGSIAKVKFKVKEGVEDGEYPIKITYDEDDIFNLTGDSISFDTGLGVITVSSCLPGDVNSDGKTNMRDVVLLQQVINAWSVVYSKEAADFNGDGKINMRDIVALQQYING